MVFARSAAASPHPLVCGSLVGWRRLLPRSSLLCFPVFLSFKRPFKSEGWEDFLLREGTSLIWASSPSTFLTRDPFKASGPPWRWHPWCSTLCVSGWSFFFPLRPLISPFLLCYWWWHAVYLCSDHIETHTLSQGTWRSCSTITRSPQL